jgi:hypothetical protein
VLVRLRLRPTHLAASFLRADGRVAESAVIKAEYGGIPDFLAARGYGPGRKRARDALPRSAKQGSV